MGVIRRNPGETLKINPIKLWGGISVLALFATISFYYFGGKYSSASVYSADNVSNSTSEDEMEVAPTLEIKDPNCEEIDQGELNESTRRLDLSGAPEAGLVAVCGRVVSSIVDNNESSGAVRSRDVRESISGATVAIYENSGADDLDETGVPGSGKNTMGELVHLFSSTQANKHGYFRIKMRAIGPNLNTVYVVVLCNGQYSGGKKINSMYHINDLSISSKCDPDITYSYITPPYSLKIVNRDLVQECTTTGSQMMESYQGGQSVAIPMYLPVKYEKASSIAVGGLIREHNYDFRYVPTTDAMIKTYAGGNGVLWNTLFETSKGALWYGDCMHRMGEIDYKDGRSYDWVCESKTIDQEYGAGGGYLINNSLPFIPEESELLPYRRMDNRSSFKQINQSPFAVQQFTTKAFGNMVTSSPFLKHPLNSSEASLNEQLDPIANCSDLEKAKLNYTFFDPAALGFLNAYVSSGWGVNLMSPGTSDMIQKLGLLGEDLERKYCRASGGTEYTLRQVLDDYDLRRKYFHTAAILPKGSGGLPWNFESDDSVFQDFVARGVDLFPFFTEAEIPHRDRSQSVLPPNHNWTANTVGNLFASGELIEEGILSRKGNLLSGLYSPYGDTPEDVFAKPEEEEEEEEVLVDEEGNMKLPEDKSKGVPGDQVWDIGNYVTGECAVSKIHNTLEGSFKDNPISRGFSDYKKVLLNMHNLFAGNPVHIIDDNVGSGTYYSSDSSTRDKLLADDAFVDKAADAGDRIFGEAPSKNRDLFDSILEITAGGMTPGGTTGVNLQKINGLGVLQLAGADIVGQIGATIGNIINIVNGVFGTNISFSFGLDSDAPTKSLGQRKPFQATFFFNDKVYYPLSAANFKEYFPSWSEGCLGCRGHEDYLWDVDGAPQKGDMCNVYPGPGNGPDEDPLNIGGMRTCKIAACRVLYMTWTWNANKGKWVEDKDTRGCTKDEEYDVLTEQVDKWPSSYDEACAGYGPEGADGSDPTWKGPDCEVPVADLIVAGPYRYVAPFELKARARAQQDFVADDNDGQKAMPIDSTLSAAHRTAKMLSSPGKAYNERNLAFMDWDYTKSPVVKKQFGFDTPAPFMGFEQTSSKGASPTNLSIRPPYNDVFYHCLIRFVDMEKNPRATPSEVSSNIVIPGIEYQWKCPVMPFVVGECDPELFNDINGGIPYPIPEADAYFSLFILAKMTPTVLDAYGFASAMTGVPCEILAGIHSNEGSNNPNQSLQDGSPINESQLFSSALEAAEMLKAMKPSKNIEDWVYKDYIEALSLYNGGGGNSNCTDPITPWCQPGTTIQSYGWDDPYPMSWIDGVHVGMYVKYCFDGTLCLDTPEVPGLENGFLPFNKPGALAVASILNKLMNER